MSAGTLGLPLDMTTLSRSVVTLKFVSEQFTVFPIRKTITTEIIFMRCDGIKGKYSPHYNLK